MQEVRSGAMTYGHRFLTTSGRAGRAVKVKTFDDYKARLMEHFVVLEREERRERIARELDVHAARLGGRVHRAAARQPGLLDEVPDLVEWPSVVPGIFPSEFLALPEEVLTTTMIHHQHYFPVVDEHGKLKPAFLAVTNVEVERPELISRNSERVLTARLRDAQFFWNADRRVPLAIASNGSTRSCSTGSWGATRGRPIASSSSRARCARGPRGAGAATSAALAGRLAKADLATDMVREFTDLQGTMGGIYAREEGHPASVWKAIYYHYLPVAVDADAPPSREQLGTRPSRGPRSRSPTSSTRWSVVRRGRAADRLARSVRPAPPGARPVQVLVDLPELTGLTVRPTVGTLLDAAEAARRVGVRSDEAARAALSTFLAERLDVRARAARLRRPQRPGGAGRPSASPTSARSRRGGCSRCCPSITGTTEFSSSRRPSSA